ncbi:MAG: hypothetical protein QOG53_1794 [Frankiales bacterium]|nr:hypothetical protein [Frankiales bacterium]
MPRSVMGMLAAGVPLTLLADLVAPPISIEVLVREGPIDPLFA